MNENSIEVVDGAAVFAGPKAVGVYQATVLASGLRMWARHGMLPNRAYKPKAMMEMASRILGRKFKAREYMEAADALTEHARAQAELLKVTS